MRKIPVHVRRKTLKTVKWGLIHAALVLFFADLVAAVWPAFETVWGGSVAHVGVALAAFLAVCAEYIHEEAEEKAAEAEAARQKETDNA